MFYGAETNTLRLFDQAERGRSGEAYNVAGDVSTSWTAYMRATKAGHELGWAPRYPTVEEGLAQVAASRRHGRS